MPQTQFLLSGANYICKFGGAALPVIGTTMTKVDLNDGTNWTLKAVDTSGLSNLQVGIQQRAWRSRADILSLDRFVGHIALGLNYSEASTPFGAARAQLMQAGNQFLTFDNLTQIPALMASLQPRDQGAHAPFIWDVAAVLECTSPYFSDIAATTLGATAIAGSVSPGTATNFNISYTGSVYVEPVWTLTIPNTNTVAIVSFALKNNDSGEALTIAFPNNLTASTAYTFTIDSSKYSVVDANAAAYDYSGSFPNLYGPASTTNHFTATLTTATGTSTNVTLNASWNPRWEM